MMRRFLLVLLGLALVFGRPATAQPTSPDDIEAIFSPEHRNGLVMQIEAAIALAQAKEGEISRAAAAEIARTASIAYAPLDDIAAEYAIVRHRMVALLNVWRRSLSEEAKAALHFGVTTVDIYDTVRILQLKQSIALMRRDLLAVEAALLALAAEHKDTPMVGRTLGQHALPITFGKKVAVWAAANRRTIDRLGVVACQLNELGVLRGAVGTHVGLGPKGQKIERRVARTLGLGPTMPADWHGMRDVFGEYATTLTLAARTYAAIGQEIFSLQMTDIGEVVEVRSGSAVSSSTMPHKTNPSLSEALMHHGRVIPAKAEVLIDDIANVFERDNTSRPNRMLEELTLDAGAMIDDLDRLIGRLEINQARMRTNLDQTDGMILAQRLVFVLQGDIGREEAEHRVAMAARKATNSALTFSDALMGDAVLAPLLAENIDELLDPTTYLGLSAQQVTETIRWLKERPTAPVCRADPLD